VKSHNRQTQGSLSGVRVIDLTTTFMGLRHRADEAPTSSKWRRRVRHLRASAAQTPGHGAIFLNANHGKRSIALDLNTPRHGDSAPLAATPMSCHQYAS